MRVMLICVDGERRPDIDTAGGRGADRRAIRFRRPAGDVGHSCAPAATGSCLPGSPAIQSPVSWAPPVRFSTRELDAVERVADDDRLLPGEAVVIELQVQPLLVANTWNRTRRPSRGMTLTWSPVVRVSTRHRQTRRTPDRA